MEEEAIWKATRNRWTASLSTSAHLDALINDLVKTASGLGVVVYCKYSSTTRMMFDRVQVWSLDGVEVSVMVS